VNRPAQFAHATLEIRTLAAECLELGTLIFDLLGVGSGQWTEGSE
jgi:hypothetical protein